MGLAEIVALIGIVGDGLFWTLAYILMLKQARRDKVYAVPYIALCANISWEFIFSFVHPRATNDPQLYINYVWLILDVGLLWQYARYGRKEFPKGLSPSWFFPFAILGLAIAFCMVLLASYDFGDMGVRVAFTQNLLMSILFIVMFLRRGGGKGQSLGIAVSKMLGTALAAVGCHLMCWYSSGYLTFLYWTIFIVDIFYCWLLWQERRTTVV